MDENKKIILVVDDSLDVIKMLIGLLTPKYKVIFSKNGLSGIESAREKKPDLILLDIMMKGIDGYEVCKRLKLDSIAKDIPVIFVTAISEAMDEARAFEVGGADYITKPFVPIIVRARISNHLKLAEYMKELKKLYNLALDANPITGLPGNNSIHKRIDLLLKDGKSDFILYADLDNFKAYNDKYGFAKGDEVIKFTADLFKKTGDELQCSDLFIGHIGGDDFVLSVEKEQVYSYIEKYLSEFDIGILDFYNEKDRKNGYITSKNRRGDVSKYPIVSISIAGVDLSKSKYENYLHVVDVCAEIKSKVKRMTGSNYIINRRTD